MAIPTRQLHPLNLEMDVAGAQESFGPVHNHKRGILHVSVAVDEDVVGGADDIATDTTREDLG